MEMKVKNDIFYILEAGNEKRIYDAEDGAIEALKGLISEKKDLDSDGMTLLEVDTTEENWQIKSVPWSKIAVELVRGGGK